MSQRQNLSKDLQMILDGFLCGFLLWAIHMLRYLYPSAFHTTGSIADVSSSYWMIAMVIPAAPLLLDLNGFYDNPLSQKYDVLFAKIAKAWFWLFVLLSGTVIFAKFEVPSRWVFFLFPLVAAFGIFLRIAITRQLLIRNYRLGRLGERTVIVGTMHEMEKFMHGLSPWERHELQVIQTCDSGLMEPTEIHRAIRLHAAGRVVFASVSEVTRELPSICEAEGIEVCIVAPSIHGIAIPPVITRIGNSRVLSFRKSNPDFWYSFIKRSLDIIGSLAGLLLFLPVGVIIAAAVKLDSPGPVIFRQQRSGRHGRRFTMYKFRSMVCNAAEIHRDLASSNEMKGPVFKISNDPRITKIGKFLRRTSLDELPQFLNVLSGEMSLVGPRPLPDYETDNIQKSLHRRRLSVKPGLTCLWQVSGRNRITDFEDWVMLDIEYIDRASIALDLWILARTVPAVLFNSGAH